jgi:hypothetical protein
MMRNLSGQFAATLNWWKGHREWVLPCNLVKSSDVGSPQLSRGCGIY